MSQTTTWGVPLVADAPITPTAFASRADAALDALLSSHSGATRPTYAVAGMPWLDTDTGQWFFYDGTNDLPILTFIGTVPATAVAAGEQGQMFAVTGWLYICIATDTWERVAIATW